MINIQTIETVNFYGDPIDVAFTEENWAYVSISQITGYLGLNHDSIVERFEKDTRLSIDFIDDNAVISLTKLNGFLMLIPISEVPEEFKQDLLRYQVECFDVLHDYWIHGIAINRRETPSDINSRFKDERKVSREVLTKACAKYAKISGIDPDDIFNKVLSLSYSIVGIEAKHEYEKLSGLQAKYLSWVESTYAKIISKFATWNELPEDMFAEATSLVRDHLSETGNAWLTMADNVPANLYH